jgi:hypothetical protein
MTGALAGELGSVFVSVVPSLAGAMGSMTAGGSEAADTAISTCPGGPAGPAAAAMAASPVVARAAGAAIAAGGPAGHTVVECVPGGTGGQLVTIEMPLELHRDLRQAVIEHGSTGMAIVLAAVYAAHPELLA